MRLQSGARRIGLSWADDASPEGGKRVCTNNTNNPGVRCYGWAIGFTARFSGILLQSVTIDNVSDL